MTETESQFIRKLRITLIGVLGPLILSGLVLTGVNLQRINNNEKKIDQNEKHIDAMEASYVPEKMMLLYIDDLRKLIEVNQGNCNERNEEVQKEISRINASLDRIMRDIYEVKNRSSMTPSEGS